MPNDDVVWTEHFVDLWPDDVALPLTSIRRARDEVLPTGGGTRLLIEFSTTMYSVAAKGHHHIRRRVLPRTGILLGIAGRRT